MKEDDFEGFYQTNNNLLSFDFICRLKWDKDKFGGVDVLRVYPGDIYIYIQDVLFNWHPPKKLKYGKPRLGESTLT